MKQAPPTTNQLPSDIAFLDRTHPLATILDLAGYAIVSVGPRHSIVLFNHGAEKMFGYAAEEIRGKPLEFLLPAGLAGVHREHSEAAVRSGAALRHSGELRQMVGRRKDGSEFPVEASFSQVELSGRSMLTLILHDVTGRTLVEEQLRATLREKEVLLEEIHHRVKNNLQVITSLLGLQARSIKDSAIRKKFEESRHRIQAMAMLHEILYESSSLAEIDFADYIRRLAEHLVHSYGTASRIRLRIRLEPLSCHRDLALPCGLILNELLSNAFKYAFPDGKSGEIRLELGRDPVGAVYLLVGDNGIGLPRDLDWKTSPTLGLRLVRTLARQMEATVEAKNSGHGTVFSITFPEGLPLNVR